MKKIILLFIVLGICLIFLPKALADLNDGLIAYYPFNGNADDESGNGYDGIIHGDTSLCEDRLGNSNSAYCFDCNGDYIEIGQEPDIPSWDNYAVSLWFLNDGGGDNTSGYGQKIIDKTVWYHDFYLRVQTQLGPGEGLLYYFTYEAGGAGIVYPSRDFRDNLWHHAVINKSGSYGELWVDGNLIDTSNNIKTVYSWGKLLIGYSLSGDHYQRKYWSGKIDDIRIHNRALSEDEILELYNEGQHILLQDDFNDNSLDPTKWTINTNIPQGDASVTEINQRIEIMNRGHLITVGQFDPLVVGPLHITGRWTFASSYWSDNFAILTRSDGIPGGGWGETQNGIYFQAECGTENTIGWESFMAISVWEDGQSSEIAKMNLPIFTGETFIFDIMDDGTNLSLTIREVGGDGTTGTLQATSPLDFDSDHIVFHNRELIGGNNVAYLDDVVVSGVVQNQPPEAICQDVTVPTESGLCTADASIDDGSFDPDGDEITLDQTPPGPYDLGDTDVTLTVTDDKEATDECTATVTVVDEEDPVISSVSASPNELWPPNHKMVPVTVAVAATDNCDSEPFCEIISVASNEPVNGLGDGNTAPDWIKTGDLTVNLRAERSGTGSGRVYTITVKCADSSENSSTDTATVTVPHDKGKNNKQNNKKKK